MKKFPHIYTLTRALVIVLVVGGFVLPYVVEAQQSGVVQCFPPNSTVPLPLATVGSQSVCEDNGGQWRAPNAPTTQSQTTPAQPRPSSNTNTECSWGNLGACFNPLTLIHGALSGLVYLILQFISLLTGLAAVVLNGVIYYTVVDVANNYARLTVINEAWKVVRDVANMGFIFVLLYAAIQTILGIGKDNKQLIVRIIIVAILINFSLFFTKVIIDASNVLALFFYDAIAPGAAQAGFTGSGSSGLADQFMQQLRLQGLFKASVNGNIGLDTIISTGLMGAVLLLIAAFIFFAVAILFIIRYVILILVIILSPIFFIASILPSGTGMDKYKNQWKDALVGQAFFAPIYFLLTWITLKILGGITSTEVFKTGGAAISDVGSIGVTSAGIVTGADLGFFGTFINFAVVIVFLITSLIVAKEWANKAGSGVAGLTKWAGGLAGGASFGLMGRAGRLASSALALSPDSKKYKQLEAMSAKGGFDGVRARLNLAAADKLRTSSFDMRGGRLGGIISSTGIDAGKAQVGGFEADKKTVREFLEKPGTEAYKKRQERARKAGVELDITDRNNIAAVKEHYENQELIDEIEDKVTAGTATPTDTARLAILKTRQTTLTDPLTGPVAKFEKAINKSSAKEIEAIVESNRFLLKSQEFANKINVQQLEAITKSDKFTESEKDTFKDARFSDVNNPAGIAALAKAESSRTDPEKAAAKATSRAIKALSDTELEMINPMHLANPTFVAEMKSSQVETLMKSSKYTQTQKDTLRKHRTKPLIDALTAGNAAEIKKLIRDTNDPKTLVSYLKLDNPRGGKVAYDVDILPTYTPQILKKMAQEMTPQEIDVLRSAIITRGGRAKTITWLNNPDTGAVEFPEL